jgi:hypothetical protein
VDTTSKSVANLDKDGGVHIFALGKLRKGSRRYTCGKTHLSAGHSPVNEELPKPLVAESHITYLFNVKSFYIIS